MTRLPEPHASISDAAVPDAAGDVRTRRPHESDTTAIDGHLSGRVVFAEQPVGHWVVLADIMSGLTAVLDQVKPLTPVRPLPSCIPLFPPTIVVRSVCGCRYNHRSG